jgi:hypothetical protein
LLGLRQAAQPGTLPRELLSTEVRVFAGLWLRAHPLPSTAASNRDEIFKESKLTIGLDLGDRTSSFDFPGHCAWVWAIFVESRKIRLYCHCNRSWVSSAAMTTLAAEVTERKLADEHVRQFAITDPLAVLGSYRGLIDVFDSEVKRHGAPDDGLRCCCPLNRIWLTCRPRVPNMRAWVPDSVRSLHSVRSFALAAC